MAAAAPAGCIFNDSLINAKMTDRLHAATALSGLHIDSGRHMATALLGDDPSEWWCGCDTRGLDAWLVLDEHDQARLGRVWRIRL